MNSNTKTGHMNISILTQAGLPQGTGVVWAMEVTPSIVSTNNLSTVPITHYALNNVQEDITSSLVSVLPAGNHSTVPLNAIAGHTDEDIQEKSYVMLPTLDNSLTNPIQFLDSKTLENNISIMRAIPPRDIQKRSICKKIIPQKYIPEHNISKIPVSKCDIEVVVKHKSSIQEINYDTLHFTHVVDSRVLPRAVLSLPISLQRYRGQICSRRLLMARTRFGPVQGVHKQITRESVKGLTLDALTKKKPLFLVHNQIGGVTHIDVTDPDKSNWLSLLPLGDKDTANVWVYEHENELFAITMRPVTPRTPLAIGYCEKYVREHSLSDCVPNINIVNALSNNNKWECEQCAQTLATPALLQRHIEVIHKEKAPKIRRNKYRCKECTQVFSRLFCLKRHKSIHCPIKIAAQKNNDTLSKSQIEDDDDVKLPSDESFQNILDFSASLMDPDRSLPNLDISSSSKSDENCSYINARTGDNRLIDFGDISPVKNACDKPQSSNPVAGDLIPCRLCTQSVLPNDYKTHFRVCRSRKLECCGRVFRNKLVYDEHVHAQHVPNTQQPQSSNPVAGDLIPCRLCTQSVLPNDYKTHFRVCRSRKLECCGRVFRNKLVYDEHVHAQHVPNTQQSEAETKENVVDSQKNINRQYPCEDCDLIFKRRGMLINHYWRAHPSRARAVKVPVLRTERRYLCSACPKLYRTAAKRDRHVNKHHPGRSLSPRSSYCIETGVKTGNAALCTFCPKQYASRAKLLQHIRSKHINKALPAK